MPEFSFKLQNVIFVDWLLQEVFCVILSLGEVRKMEQMGTLSYNVFFFGFSFFVTGRVNYMTRL